jgi:hypothetical protein
MAPCSLVDKYKHYGGTKLPSTSWQMDTDGSSENIVPLHQTTRRHIQKPIILSLYRAANQLQCKQIFSY